MSLFPDRRTPGTPNVAKCLGDAVDQGRLSREQAEEALAYVKRLMDERPGTSEGAAAVPEAERNAWATALAAALRHEPGAAALLRALAVAWPTDLPARLHAARAGNGVIDGTLEA
jgi:hypothetical protein